MSDEQKNDNTDVKFDICPCCGKPTLPKPLKLNSELLDHFMACMLTGVQFSHSYPMFDGRLTITVSQISPEGYKDIATVNSLLDELRDKKIDELNNINFDDFKTRIAIYGSVPEITINGDEKKTYRPADSVFEVCADLIKLKNKILSGEDKDLWVSSANEAYKKLTNFSFMSGFPVRSVIAVVETHNRILQLMLDSGFDESFWSGIELV